MINYIYLLGLIVVFLSLSILIATYTFSKYTVILVGLLVICGYLIFIQMKALSKYKYHQDFLKATRRSLQKYDIIGTFKVPKRNSPLHCQYIIFLPNKILLFYVSNYRGHVTVNENIYDDRKQVLKNITNIKNYSMLDTRYLINEYNHFREKNFSYNDINVIPICYLPNATISQNVQHNILFCNPTSIDSILDYNILQDNLVYPYEDFIRYLNDPKRTLK